MKTPSISDAVKSSTAVAPVPKHVSAAHAAIEPTSKQVRLNVEVTQDLHARIKMQALQEKKTVKNLVIEILENHIK